eukprot:CAMPEP_0172661976 /NCGR_PEP_ID=MMETSP1074-20121228/5068_1 /TAXON_ID=2916 /ORGANISM="Ceratium fusus, Strain PA161109" /LENGTH=32 /DNA_ID= /DNA_START= /DNA_END= /DNA_ORIENTATION=
MARSDEVLLLILLMLQPLAATPDATLAAAIAN